MSERLATTPKSARSRSGLCLAVGPAAHGAVTNNGDGTLTYSPAAGFSGFDTFTYTICAPEGCLTTSSTAAVTVEVRRGKGKKR